MNEFANKGISRISAARLNAEALMKPANTRESSLKLEQVREREALSAKTARLRELRLAKEAADKEAAGPHTLTKSKSAAAATAQVLAFAVRSLRTLRSD
jgi:hypothetical protein